MSHEIRTPMNAIIGFSNLLKTKDLNESKKEQYLELINHGGKRLLQLISDIVDISKIDAKQMTIHKAECDVHKILHLVYEQFRIELPNENVKLILEKGIAQEKVQLITDEHRLIQVLSNLIENALKFTTSGTISFGYKNDNHELTFFVKDSGIGIDKKYHETIFDRFNQVEDHNSTTGKGTGLGLTIVKSLVELLGGKIWIASETGKGACFYFTLPYHQDK